MKRRKTTFFLMLLMLFTTLSFYGCNTSSNNRLFLSNDAAYAELFLSQTSDSYTWLLPDCGPSRNPYSDMDKGALWECLDVQARPALENGVGKEFLPQALCTVVFEVDRNKTDFLPHSWDELRNTPVGIRISDDDFMKRIVLAAASRGLEGENYTNNSAIKMFEYLYSKGLLHLSKTDDQPITICLDSQAVQQCRKGKDIEIIVPKDGTFSYTLGLFSNSSFAGLSDQVLLDGGFKLPDGRSTDPAYPENSDYSSAYSVCDYEHFAFVTDNATINFRRSVAHARLCSSADRKESILFFTLDMLFVLLWTIYAIHRSPRTDVRNWVRLISFLCIGWLFLSAFKYQLPQNYLSRICWYGYYIFLLGLPLSLLYMSAILDKPFRKNHLPYWLIPFFVLYALFLIAVFTNDFHQLIFNFDINGDWTYHYSYGPVYYILLFFCYFTFFLAFGILIKKGRKSPKRFAIWQPLLVAGLLVFYNIGYILDIPLVKESNLAFVFCILAVLFAESVLHSGLIPTNTYYRKLFDLTGLQLIDFSGNTVLSSPKAQALTKEQILHIGLSPDGVISADENTLLHHQSIHGGTAVWFEDISSLYETRQKIESSIKSIESSNALLRNEEDIKRKEITAKVNAQLFSMLEEDISEKTSILAKAIQNLSNCADKEKQLSYIALLLCHIKRRCNLFFLAQQNSLIPSSELVVYLDELCEFAQRSQIQVLFHCGLQKPFTIHVATLCYDFFFSLLSWSIKESGATLIGRLEEKNDHLVFSVLSSEPAPKSIFSTQLLDSLESGETNLKLQPQDDLYSIVLSIIRKEDINDQSLPSF